MASISQREWRHVAYFTVGVLVITTVPYLLAWWLQDRSWLFNGFVFGVEDGNAYLGKMRLGVRGYWDFFLFFTPEAHASAPLFYLPYILPGQFLGLFMDSRDPALFGWMVLTFHAMRLGFDALLIVSIYRFIALFLDTSSQRFMALLLACLGGGLGWLLILIGKSNLLGDLPAEFYIPEGFSFYILYGLPHIALARALLLIGLHLLITQPRYAQAIGAGLCWAGVGLCVPFYLLVIYGILGGWGLARWLRNKRFPKAFAVQGLLASSLTFPLLLYYLMVFNQNKAFAQWSSQNLLPSPHPLHYLLAYGILAILAMFSLRRYLPITDTNALLIAWVLMVPLWVYLPINVQRRLAEGVLVPLAILATPALFHVRWQMGIVVILLLSSLLLLIGSTFAVLQQTRPIYRPYDEVAALDWLNDYADENAVALGTFETGNFLPARTNLRAFLGHGPETLYASDKRDLVDRFFADQMTEAERLSFYEQYHIRYIFYGPLERELASHQAQPTWTHSVALLYDYDGYQIFEVLLTCTDETCALGCHCSSLPSR